MGIVVFNPQALKSHFLPFIGQEGPELDDAILLHTVYDPLLNMSPPVELHFKGMNLCRD